MQTQTTEHLHLNESNRESAGNKKQLYKWVCAFLFITIFLTLIWLNIFFLTKGKVDFGELLTTLFFNTKKTATNDTVSNELSTAPIYRAVWICLASIIAAIALVISGSIVQSLTQNPLADTTTLGFIDATIFGIIFMKGIFSADIDSSNYLVFYFLFAFLGGGITLFLLNFIFKKPQHKNKHLQVIFIGLVLNMMFKTFTYLIKTYNSNAVNASFALAMGGAENIYHLYSKQFLCLKLAAGGIFITFMLAWMFSNKLNLFELGEEQAKTLGVNVKLFKQFGYALALITTTISIILIGNVAFVGLISTHVVRSLLQTRKYQIIIPFGALLASILLLFGIFLNSLFPFISSSIFILFLGGCTLLSLTLQNKDL